MKGSKTGSKSKFIQHRLTRNVVLVLGWLCIGLGVLGIFLPLLPTTPFLLLAAGCFLRTSPKTYRWLVRHPKLGKFIISYFEGKGIPLKTKIYSVSAMLIAVGLTIYIAELDGIVIGILFAVAIFAMVYIFRLPTLKADKSGE